VAKTPGNETGKVILSMISTKSYVPVKVITKYYFKKINRFRACVRLIPRPLFDLHKAAADLLGFAIFDRHDWIRCVALIPARRRLTISDH
jgi:hypothetical protein